MKLLLSVLLAVGAFGCTPIETDRIYGRDLATAYPAFARLPQVLDFGAAPVAGAHRTLRFAELAQIGKQNGVAIEAGTEICFERTAQRLEPGSLRDALMRVLDRRVAMEILDFSRGPLPVGRLEFRAADLSPNGFWRGRQLYGDHRSVPVWVRVRITDLETGKLLSLPNSIGPAEVTRGQTVRVEVSSGSVLLAFDAAAESSGHIGEAVTIRNPENGQRIRAVVEAKGKVGIRK